MESINNAIKELYIIRCFIEELAYESDTVDRKEVLEIIDNHFKKSIEHLRNNRNSLALSTTLHRSITFSKYKEKDFVKIFNK